MNVAATGQLSLADRASDSSRELWKLPRDLGHEEIRAVEGRLLERRPQVFLLDIRRLERCEPTAEAHLLDLLTLSRRLSIPITLLVNTTSVRGSQRMANRYKDLFSGPLVGFLLSWFATTVRDERGNDHTASVKALARRTVGSSATPGLVRHGEQRTALISTEPGVKLAELVEEESPKHLAQLVLEELRHLGLESFEHDVFRVAVCVQQAIQNVLLHSGRQLPATQAHSFGFISMRRINRESAVRLAEVSRDDPLGQYWRSHSQKSDRHLALTIADNGGGIPATMTGRRSVYEDSTADPEVKELLSALGPGSSIRWSSHGRGLGMPRMLDAITQCKGLMIIRSGRLRAHARLDEKEARLLGVQRLPYAIGTTLVFLFPEPLGEKQPNG